MRYVSFRDLETSLVKMCNCALFCNVGCALDPFSGRMNLVMASALKENSKKTQSKFGERRVFRGYK